MSLNRHINTLRNAFRVIKVKPRFFIFQSLFTVSIATLDAFSLVLLAPLAKGVLQKDFTFLYSTPFFANIMNCFPRSSADKLNTSSIVLIIVLIFVATLAKGVVEYFLHVYTAYEKTQAAFNLTNTVFGKYMRFGKYYYDKNSLGYIGQVWSMSNEMVGIIGCLSESFTYFFTLIIFLAFMFFISWKFSLCAVILMPFVYYATRGLLRKIKKLSQQRTDISIKLSRELFNILSCISLVKAYTQEDVLRERFETLNNELRKANYHIEKKARLITPIQSLIALLAFLLLIVTAVFMFGKSQSGQITWLILFFLLLRRAIILFSYLNYSVSTLIQFEAPLREVSKVFDDKDKFFIVGGTKKFTGLREGIDFCRLNFAYYPGSPVLKDLSFSIEKGRMTAIVGPTGAGKTTLLNLIMRFYDCPPGSIFVDGVDIREITLKSLRDVIAYVGQDLLLFDASLRTNITFGLDEHIEEDRLIEITKKARLYDNIMRFSDKFDTLIGDKGVKLSGGEKQRVSLARALLKNSEILILDEATNSLDTITERLIQEAIAEASKGKTVIVVAHRLTTIKNANKIIVIENGTLIEEGGLTELLNKKNKFYEYWQAQKFF